MRKSRIVIATAVILIAVMAVAAAAGYLINVNMIHSGVKKTVTVQRDEDIDISETAKKRIEDLDPECAIVLGAGLKDSETPSKMLKDRLDLGIELYKENLVPKLLLTGDNGQVQHNEIHVMLKYCIKHGVPEDDIFCDHAGFSTYDSMYRADSIFCVRRAVVVTQYYHLFRALYLADEMGIDVLGAASDQQQPYTFQEQRNKRELLARVKDRLMAVLKPKPKYLGDKIPITGDSGKISHGE